MSSFMISIAGQRRWVLLLVLMSVGAGLAYRGVLVRAAGVGQRVEWEVVGKEGQYADWNAFLAAWF